MSLSKVLQVLSVILALGGTYLITFGLRVRMGISDDLRKKLRLDERGLITPSDVRQRTALVIWGLVMVTIAGFLQLWVILRS